MTLQVQGLQPYENLKQFLKQWKRKMMILNNWNFKQLKNWCEILYHHINLI